MSRLFVWVRMPDATIRGPTLIGRGSEARGPKVVARRDVVAHARRWYWNVVVHRNRGPTPSCSEHTLSFRSSFGCPSYADLLEIADEWKVGDPSEIVSRVIGSVRKFTSTAKKLNVRGTASLEALWKDIQRRIEALSA